MAGTNVFFSYDLCLAMFMSTAWGAALIVKPVDRIAVDDVSASTTSPADKWRPSARHNCGTRQSNGQSHVMDSAWHSRFGIQYIGNKQQEPEHSAMGMTNVAQMSS
ncbi:hypothetical protein J7T55_015517 [Diaporthe amygdali]|uniref:uncharacterized protein n=1 Tax=Phomopsis amygdali TaxID=1214568 RepID=UPI0022FF1146|nr:uncharacterized protein J7T55_015517 [Diaporthe amygdali]KAJ0120783.1 hypothetical protein J7T55_015517 [Diaporthe amygdali]